MPDDLGNAGTPEERRTGLGGSDAAAALGMSPWKTPYELWEEKTGRAPPPEVNEPMLWGQLLEDLIRSEYIRRTGMDARRVPEIIRHPDYQWMYAHVDGRVVNAPKKVILECKTARTTRGWGDEDTDEVPTNYLLQIHHYLAVTQAEVCDVAVLFGGSDFRLYQVHCDREIERDLIEREARFWARVQGDEPPPDPVTVDDAVRRWGRSQAAGTITAGEAALAAVEHLRSIHRQVKALEVLQKEGQLHLMSLMGDEASTLIHPYGEDVLCTWKLDKGRKGYTVEPREPQRRFIMKYPEDANV